MRITSFRARIASLSVLCSSLVLLITALVVTDIIWTSELGRVDGFLSNMVKWRLVRYSMPPPMERPEPGPFGKGDRFEGRWPDADNDGPPDKDLRRKGHRGGTDDNFVPGGGPDVEPPFMREPPWRRNRGMQVADRATSAPIVIFLYKDIDEERIQKSNYWPASLDGNKLGISTNSSIKTQTISADGRWWRIATGGTPTRIVVFGVNLDPAISNIRQVASAFLLSIPAALLLIMLGAMFMASRALRPVNELTRLVERITASGLSERVTAHVKDTEFENLIVVFNQMMDRLERSFMQANRFSADAAHELRTPISILQGYVEQMLRHAESGSRQQQQLGEMVDEIHRIKSILEKLLLLARMDAGQVELKTSPIDLSAMIYGIVEDVQAIAPALSVESKIASGIQVEADAALLETAIQNLGSNAAKYNFEKNGVISIQLHREPGKAVFSIANTGPRIPHEDREKIFDRFYRADKSRSREVDGLGLGLSLAREIVQAHHGTLELSDGASDLNRFVLTLPLSTN